MILTNSKTKYEKLKLLRYDGRNINIKYDNDKFKMMGYHMYMTPEQAAYGLKLFEKNMKKKQKEITYLDYSNLNKYKKIFK
jgi:dTDP-4-amino-4,6-dideoxygalactose transaminase